MFEIKNVSKKYGSEYAIKNLNLEIGKGLNFIVGASGSGKTTLLKLISGMDNDFEGEVLYLGQSIKNLTNNEKAYYYNSKFGFIWQDFNLIDDMTVEENITLPLHIKNVSVKHEVEKVLRQLNISKLKNQKVKNLSGGQKQRVAMARELVKNPQVIIADEPTSALDSNTSIEAIKILKEISKYRTVIIVTHDMSLIDEHSKVYKLDKGELISQPQTVDVETKLRKEASPKKLKLSNAFKIGFTNNKSKIQRSVVTCLSVIVSSVLMMTSISGAILQGGNQSFEQLFDEYGNSILDLSIAKSFISGSSAGGDSDGPNVDIDQDISGLYDKYISDERVEHLVFNKAFNDIKVSIGEEEYDILPSNSVPVLNEVILGDIPRNKGEVLVSESFVKLIGVSNEEVIGKEIDFSGSIFNWDSGSPEPKDINIKAEIVGVADTTIIVNYDGTSQEIEIEDSFFFDKETLNEVNNQANVKDNSHNFSMRVKSPGSLIEIKNELNEVGIVPTGQFELVEDIVKLNSQSSSLSKDSTIIIVGLAIASIISISLVTSIIRKREYAIYKVCGYSNSQLSLILFAENIMLALVSALSLIVLSPVINILTKITFASSIANIKTLSLGVILVLGISFICYIISNQISKVSKPSIVLKSGGR